MASIFLSYRRTDSPQACRVHDWLVQRFGHDAVFMDVAAIPFAVSFPDFIRQAIASSKVLVTLIGTGWLARIHEAGDPVRTELETAIAGRIPILPLLIGNAAMPTAEELPPSLSPIAYQNASTIGVLHDFDSHMRSLLPKIESILGALAVQSAATSAPEVIRHACDGIIRFLRDEMTPATVACAWKVAGSHDFGRDRVDSVTLFLHRVARLAELLELHFILSFWFRDGSKEHAFAGWVLHQFEETPFIPERYLALPDNVAGWTLKIRPSDEDARQVWKMITSDPLRLSLAYIGTVSPRGCG
jgi:hypothetical protein